MWGSCVVPIIDRLTLLTYTLLYLQALTYLTIFNDVQCWQEHCLTSHIRSTFNRYWTDSTDELCWLLTEKQAALLCSCIIIMQQVSMTVMSATKAVEDKLHWLVKWYINTSLMLQSPKWPIHWYTEHCHLHGNVYMSIAGLTLTDWTSMLLLWIWLCVELQSTGLDTDPGPSCSFTAPDRGY